MAIQPSISRSVITRFALGASALALTLGLGSPALAGDPFGRNDPAIAIGDRTEAAFRAMFQESDYAQAATLLEQARAAEPGEPLIYPMLALLANYQGDNARLADYAAQTRRAAEGIQASQPLRGHLYSAVADFIEGAYILSEDGDGPVRGLPKAFGKLRGFNSQMKAARNINANDPELNLLEGFTDMYASAYLPLASTEDAVAKLQKAGPDYVADWLTALGYKILGKHDQGLAAVDRGLARQPDHAEMHYLKAQLEMQRAKADPSSLQSARTHFDAALDQREQLPKALVGQIMRERCLNQEQLDGQDRSCSGLMKQTIRNSGDSPWGPAELPAL